MKGCTASKKYLNTRKLADLGRFWISLPKNHFTENFWPKGHLTETPYDRTPFDRMPFDRKFIRPNHRLTKRRAVWPKGHMIVFFSENGHLTESTFDKKCLLTEKKLRTRLLKRKFIWPKTFSENYHLTESSFDRKLFRKMVIWPKGHLTERVIWPKGHLTECFFFFEKWSFLKNCHLTDCSYSIHSKKHVADFTFMVRRINVNRHTPSTYVFLLWFHDSDNWFYVSGVFYLKNNFLARPRFEPATARNTFQHKNTKPQPSVLGYSSSWKLNNQLPISIIFWIWSILKNVGSMFWLT
jgi:hypothetical protein